MGLSQRAAVVKINEVKEETTKSKSAAGLRFQRFNAGDLEHEEKGCQLESFDEVEEACQDIFDSKSK
ncbi:hypothetical protein KIN20_033439 [Parelaphostrongylus tenuis]|uniref:Uncharacterized protein n=1 Tax=Parelaphostrongylus tenuis TaxID=148309 RepID=A0AAD5R8L4_PARTN|nr:hypothetical protein KIN20_033439 [Parelaphostrongylus tenuis]